MLTHKFTKSQAPARLLLSAVAMLVAATLLSLPADAQRATPKNLTSDIPNVGSFNDTHLVNAWGIVRQPVGSVVDLRQWDGAVHSVHCLGRAAGTGGHYSRGGRQSRNPDGNGLQRHL